MTPPSGHIYLHHDPDRPPSARARFLGAILLAPAPPGLLRPQAQAPPGTLRGQDAAQAILGPPTDRLTAPGRTVDQVQVGGAVGRGGGATSGATLVGGEEAGEGTAGAQN